MVPLLAENLRQYTSSPILYLTNARLECINQPKGPEVVYYRTELSLV